MRGRIYLAVLAIAVGGCVPMRVYDSPEIRVSVADRATGKPIAGAEVLNPDVRLRASTDANGQAVLPPKSHLTVWFVNADPAPESLALHVTANGYAPADGSVCFYPIKNDATPSNAMRIALEPAAASTQPSTDAPVSRCR
jgi:hypothetical protein